MAEMKPIEMIFLCEPQAYKASDGGEVCFQAKSVGELIRCGECKHRDPEDHKCDCGEMERQGCPFPVDDNYYCAYGKRKGGDE